MNSRQELVKELTVEYRNKLINYVTDIADSTSLHCKVLNRNTNQEIVVAYKFWNDDESMSGYITLHIPYDVTKEPYLKWDHDYLHYKEWTTNRILNFYELMDGIERVINGFNNSKLKL